MRIRLPSKHFKASPKISRLAMMLCKRFSLPLRNVEDLLRERGAEISRETVRCWRHRFGPKFVPEIRKRRVERKSASRQPQRLDDVFVKINGERHYLWRAVDLQGEVLESLLAKHPDGKAAMKLLSKAMKKYVGAHAVVTDKLRFNRAALRVFGAADRHATGLWLNWMTENCLRPFRRRERATLRFPHGLWPGLLTRC